MIFLKNKKPKTNQLAALIYFRLVIMAPFLLLSNNRFPGVCAEG